MDGLKEPRPIYRQGKKLEMYGLIEELDEIYDSNLKATVCAYATYDEVSNETLSDLNNIKQTLELLEKLDYLLPEEAEALLETAIEKRHYVLEHLEEFDEYGNR